MDRINGYNKVSKNIISLYIMKLIKKIYNNNKLCQILMWKIQILLHVI